MAPVCEDLGIDYNIDILFHGNALVGVAIGMMYVSRLTERQWSVGECYVAVAAVSTGGWRGMAFYSNVWLFLLSGLIFGSGMSFPTRLCMSAVIDQWFRACARLRKGRVLAIRRLAWTVFQLCTWSS